MDRKKTEGKMLGPYLEEYARTDVVRFASEIAESCAKQSAVTAATQSAMKIFRKICIGRR